VGKVAEVGWRLLNASAIHFAFEAVAQSQHRKSEVLSYHHFSVDDEKSRERSTPLKTGP
jgi:hypothetical protein